jgi:hypothetical protein
LENQILDIMENLIAKWKIIERAVAALEKCIDPAAKVAWNVRLPVLGEKSGRTRECDVVVQIGEEPRVTTSIVEVQDRKSKPTLNDFGGWLLKMKEVGAQHLICISKAGFPRSIVDKAAAIGPSVRLMTLQSLEKKGIDLPRLKETISKVHFRPRSLDMWLEIAIEKNTKEESSPPPLDSKVFRICGGPEVSINDLIDNYLFCSPRAINDLPVGDNIPLSIHYDFASRGEVEFRLEFKDSSGNWIRLKTLQIEILVSHHKKQGKFESLCYEQVGWGEIGWILKGVVGEGSESLEVIIPVRTLDDGFYSYGYPVAIGKPEAIVSIGQLGFRATKSFDGSKKNS